VGVLAVISLFFFVAALYVSLFVPPAFAPRVYIRWVDGTSDATRTAAEQQLRLVEGERADGMTWGYDLVDPSEREIRAIIAEPAVADTGNIDRERVVVADVTRVGRTRVRGGLSLWRDAPFVPWVTRFAAASFVLCAIWLATSGRSALRVTAGR
jgi:hypothetical protein